MKLIKKLLKAIVVLAIFLAILVLILYKEKNADKYNVVKWDNYYNENNLDIFYTKEDKRLETINSTYKIDEFLSEKENELDKVLKVIDIVNSIVEYDDVKDADYFNGYDILSKKVDGKKVSGRDMAIITRDFLTSAGFTSRIGEFKNEKGWFNKDKSYYIVEYWSLKYSKWIMIDFREKGYFTDSEKPCSAIEIATQNAKKIEYVGTSSKSEYLRDKKKLFDTYTIFIDNTLDMSKSNSVVTFVQSEDGVYIEHNNKYLKPTIFTEETKIFEMEPNYVSNEEDKGAYIILMKKEGDNDFFIIGGFKSGSILSEYYISKDNGEFSKINKYDEIELKSGSHVIEISTDGKSVLSKVEINVKKN